MSSDDNISNIVMAVLELVLKSVKSIRRMGGGNRNVSPPSCNAKHMPKRMGNSISIVNLSTMVAGVSLRVEQLATLSQRTDQLDRFVLTQNRLLDFYSILQALAIRQYALVEG